MFGFHCVDAKCLLVSGFVEERVWLVDTLAGTSSDVIAFSVTLRRRISSTSTPRPTPLTFSSSGTDRAPRDIRRDHLAGTLWLFLFNPNAI